MPPFHITHGLMIPCHASSKQKYATCLHVSADRFFFKVMQEEDLLKHAVTAWLPHWTANIEGPVVGAWMSLKDAVGAPAAPLIRFRGANSHCHCPEAFKSQTSLN